MSEQKYFVKLIPEVVYYSSYDGFESTVYTNLWLDKSGIFVPSIDRDKITKSELAEIMDGAFYHVSDDKCDYCRYSSDTCGDEHCGEWINPLIELIPVEEEMK